MPSTSGLEIKRAFVDVPGGQVHMRLCGAGGARPLVMLHSNPGSSAMVAPLMRRFGATRKVIAPDTAGFGDSTPLAAQKPTIEDYAARALQALDALGITEFDLYGSHTGANMAVEMAIARPDAARHVILDGIALYTPEMRRDLLANYAPPLLPDLDGKHLMWTWHFVRDQWMFWPWFKRDAAHRRDLGLPPPDYLHEVVLDVLKSLGTFQLGYWASFLYEKEKRLPLLRVPALVASAKTDIFFPDLEKIAALVPQCRTAVIGGETEEERAQATALFTRFLDDTLT